MLHVDRYYLVLNCLLGNEIIYKEWHLDVGKEIQLQTDHYRGVSWIRWQGRRPARPGRPIRILRVFWECLAEDPVKMVFDTDLQESFYHILGVTGDMESKWAMFHTGIAEAAVQSYCLC